MQKLSPQGKIILKRRIEYYEEVTKDGTTDQIQHSCKVGIIDKRNIYNANKCNYSARLNSLPVQT